ncbi:metallopeptidase TldD-related protein [Amycolatopsis sp. NPDC005003]
MSAEDWAELALSACRDADGCVAIADDTSVTHLRWAGNRPTTSGRTRTESLTVIAVADGATGAATANGGLDAATVTRLVRAAEHAAAQAIRAERPRTLRAPAGGNGRGCGPLAATETPFGHFVADLARAFEDARGTGHLLYGYAEHRVLTTCLATSTGLRLHHSRPAGLLDLTAKTADRTASAWCGHVVGDFAEADPEATVRHLRERLSWARRQVPLRPGRYEVLLPPSATADLMLHLYEAATAQEAVDGGSVFSGPAGGTRIGERLTGARLTLYSDPAEPGLECVPFTVAKASGATASVFDNGFPLSRTDWITDGVLTALVDPGRTPEIGNLVLTGGSADGLDALIARTQRGLLLTSLWYLRDVDPRTLLLTGLTRDGVYLVENGEVTGAVPDFRFNESPVDVLGRVTETGCTERALPREWADARARTAMPALRVADFGVSSPSSS